MLLPIDGSADDGQPYRESDVAWGAVPEVKALSFGLCQLPPFQNIAARSHRRSVQRGLLQRH